MSELSRGNRFTVTAMQLNAYVTAYSGLDVYIALFLDGRITRPHFEIMVMDVRNRLNEQKQTIDTMVESLLAQPSAGDGDVLPTE